MVVMWLMLLLSQSLSPDGVLCCSLPASAFNLQILFNTKKQNCQFFFFSVSADAAEPSMEHVYKCGYVCVFHFKNPLCFKKVVQQREANK